MLQCKCRENCNICFRTEEELLIAAACQVQLQQQSRGTAAAVNCSCSCCGLSPHQPGTADQTAASCSQDAVAAALPTSSEVHRKLQLLLSQRTAAATNCSCRKVAASPAFPPPGLKVHRKQPLVLRTMACNCSSICRLISF